MHIEKDVHAVVALHHGQVIEEHYGAGEDFKWNESLGQVTFGPDTLHDIRSISKSVTSLVYGIALGEGLVPGADEPLLEHFPKYPDLGRDPQRAKLRVEHALTMTLGLDWNENVPYTSVANSEIAMEFAEDRYRYVLERPIVEEPGKQWHYCGGASALLGALIAQGTGMPLEDYARAKLFGPLGIDTFEWMAGYDGVAAPASGLRLRTRDLAAIGQLVLDGGRDIVPASWIEASLTPHVQKEDGGSYGYQWHLSPEPWVAGFGNGGQILMILRERGLVVAINAGAYDNDRGSSWAALEAIRAAV